MINTNELNIKDPLITLNEGGNNTSAINSGFEIEGTGGSIVASMKLDNNLDFVINKSLTVDNNLLVKGNCQLGDGSLDSHVINGSTTFSNSVLMNGDLTLVGGDITGVDNISATSGNITNLTTSTFTASTYGPINSTGNITTTGDISCVNLSATGNTNISGGLTVDTSTLKLDASLNRVGINTATPAYTLDVNGIMTGRSDIYQGGSNTYYYDFTNSKSKVLRNIGTNDAAGTEFSGNLLDRGGGYSFQQRGTQPGSYKTGGMFGWNALTAGLTGGNYNFIQSTQASNSLSGIGHVYGFGFPYSFDGTNYVSYPDYFLFLQSTSGGANTCQFLLKKNEGGQFTHNNESATSTLGLVTAGVTNCALKVNGGEYITRNLLVNEGITTSTGDINVSTSNKGIVFSGATDKIYNTTGSGISCDTNQFKIWNSGHTVSNFTCVSPVSSPSTTGVYIDANGKCGINTNPDNLYNFHVLGDTRLQGSCIIQGTNNISGDQAVSGSQNVVGQITSQGTTLKVVTPVSPVSYLQIDSGGRVGINCNPNNLYELDINGNIRCVGTSTFNNNAAFSSSVDIQGAFGVGGVTTHSNDINFNGNGKVITLSGTGAYINCLPSSYINLDFIERYRRGGKKQTMMSLRFNSTTLTQNTRPQLTLTNGYTYPTGNLPANNTVYLQADKSTFEITSISGGGTYKIEVRVCEAATANIQRTFQLFTSADGVTYTLHEEKRSVFIYNAFNPTYFSHQYDFILDTQALGIYYFYLYYTGGTGNITQTSLGQSSVLVYQIS